MSYVSSIVETFGGVRAMAKAVGRPASTVQSWKDRGSIPDDHKPGVLAAAQRLGLGIEPPDFFPFDKNEAGTAA